MGSGSIEYVSLRYSHVARYNIRSLSYLPSNVSSFLLLLLIFKMLKTNDEYASLNDLRRWLNRLIRFVINSIIIIVIVLVAIVPNISLLLLFFMYRSKQIQKITLLTFILSVDSFVSSVFLIQWKFIIHNIHHQNILVFSFVMKSVTFAVSILSSSSSSKLVRCFRFLFFLLVVFSSSLLSD